jgi:hypothetical protein
VAGVSVRDAPTRYGEYRGLADSTPRHPSYDGADGDLSGAINAGDYAVWQANFGLTLAELGTAGTAGATVVPGPATGALVVLPAIAAVVGRSISRRSRG